MPDKNEQFQWITNLARIALIVTQSVLGLAIAVTVAMTILKALKISDGPPWEALAPWVLMILVEIAAVVWTFVLHGLVSLFVAVEYSARNSANRLSRLETLAADQSESSRKLVDLGSLSDQAKSLVYRDRELEAVRETIHEDLIKQDYGTAAVLIDAVETRFGYPDEAQRMREELEASRKATLEEKIDAAVARIQQIIDRRDWSRATRETRRILRLFPDNPKIASLPERIQQARTEHKRELLERYGEAVKKNDIDTSIKLLKELDLYLSPQEVAALGLEESVRGVFKERLHQLGVQFAIRVTDQQWDEAIAAGEEIIREFPNSRMSQEVREKMGVLKAKARSAGSAPPPQE